MDKIRSEKILKGSILVLGIVFILIGFYYLPNTKSIGIIKATPIDSTISIENSTDTTNTTTVSVSSSIKKEYKAQGISSGCNDCFNYSLDYSYKFMTLGVGIFLLLFLIPSLKDFNFLGLFSATFREKVEAFKAEYNDVTQQSLTIEPQYRANITRKETRSMQRDESSADNIKEITTYEFDTQKGKWGGKSENQGRRLTALVTPFPNNAELFNIELKVISTNYNNPLRGKVVFHLHDTFANPNPSVYVLEGQAKLNLVAWGAFTVGAETDNGAVQLELNLAELKDAPILFKTI